MALPEACEKCTATGGNWVESAKGGMERCICPRGLALTEMARLAATPAIPRPPVISSKEATVHAEALAGIYGYSLGQAVPLIGNEIRSMCESSAQAADFVKRFARLYKKWPGGIDEIRWAFCQMGFRPLDAIEPVGDSEVYPEGLPEAAGGRPALGLEAPLRDPRSRELPPGEAGDLVRSLVGRKGF